MAHKFKKYINIKHRYLVALSVVLLVFLLAILELTNTTLLLHKKPQIVTKTPASSSQTTKTTPSSNQPSSNKVDTTTTAVLIAPFGNFVSSHHVTMSTPIASVCNTTSGATCVINFVSNNVTKSLTTEMADSTGAAYWSNWTPKSINLNIGSWHIQAVATLNGQIKTANDALNLEVSQ